MEENKDDALMEFYKKLNSVNDDRSLVILTNSFLELIVTTLIEEHCKNDNKINSGNSTYNYSVKLVILNELNIIYDELYESLDWLRSLRNDFAHKPLFELKDGHKGTIKEHINKHTPNNREIALKNLCYVLLKSIWNQNREILIPHYLPSINNK